MVSKYLKSNISNECFFRCSSETQPKSIQFPPQALLPEQPSPPSSSPSPSSPQTRPHARHRRTQHRPDAPPARDVGRVFHPPLRLPSASLPFASLPSLPPTDITAGTRTLATRASSPPSPTLTPTAGPVASLIDRSSFHHYHHSSERRTPFTLPSLLALQAKGKKIYIYK